MAEWKMNPPKFQNAPPRLHMRKAVNQVHISYLNKNGTVRTQHTLIYL